MSIPPHIRGQVEARTPPRGAGRDREAHALPAQSRVLHRSSRTTTPYPDAQGTALEGDAALVLDDDYALRAAAIDTAAARRRSVHDAATA